MSERWLRDRVRKASTHLVLSLAELLLGVLESARRKGGDRGPEVAISKR